MNQEEESGKLGNPNHEVAAKLATLAARILDEALGLTVPFDSRLDAFKAVTNYHVGMSKVKRTSDDDLPTGDSMGAFKRELASK